MRKNDNAAPYLFLLFCAALLACGCGKKLEPEDIVFAQPEQAVAEARKMIAEKRANPGLYADWIEPRALHECLRIPNLVCAAVYDDHVNLLIKKIPDWWVGARIWSVDSTLKHADAKTRYADIFFFTYSNDFPDSPANMR